MTLFRRFKGLLFPGDIFPDQEAMRLFTEIEDAYGAPTRFYHDLGHIRNCLNVFDSVNSAAIEPKAICAAIYYHDIIYDVRAKDNEEQSACLAYQRLAENGFCEHFCETVKNLILATTHAGGLTDPDQQVIADVDLSELAVNWATFKQATENLREEDSGASDEEFSLRRKAFFGKLLGRPTIYYGLPFQILFEERARENMQRALRQI